MDERVELFLQETGPALCVDIGALTQKAILARPGWRPETWSRFLLPSPARLVTQRIRELTLLKRNIWLYGGDMDGSFCEAVRAHIGAGLSIAATETAARSIHDNIEATRQLGVKIADYCPSGHVPIRLADYDPEFWAAFIRLSALPHPHMVLAAAQDHGYNIKGNREARMSRWRETLLREPDPIRWIHEKAPDDMGRLKALQAATGGPVADTAAAAVLGALCDEAFFDRCYRQGVTLLNAGNTHVLAALVYQAKVYGIYEHHMEKRGVELLLKDLEEFRKRWLPEEKAHASGASGAAFGEDIAAAGDWRPTFILGPKRVIFRDCGQFLAPHGDMPHAGCFGLLYGWSRAHARV